MENCIHEHLTMKECGVIDNGNCTTLAYNVYCANCDTCLAIGLGFVDARVFCERWTEHDTLKAKAELFEEAISCLNFTRKRLKHFGFATEEISLILSKAEELSERPPPNALNVLHGTSSSY